MTRIRSGIIVDEFVTNSQLRRNWNTRIQKWNLLLWNSILQNGTRSNQLLNEQNQVTITNTTEHSECMFSKLQPRTLLNTVSACSVSYNHEHY